MDKNKLVDNLCTFVCVLALIIGFGKFTCKEVDLYKAKDLQIHQVKIELIKAKYNAGDIKVITGLYY